MHLLRKLESTLRMQESTSSASPLRNNRIILYSSLLLAIFVIVIIVLFALIQMRQLTDARTALNTENMAKLMEQSYDGLIDTIDVALLSSADEISRQLAARTGNPQTITQYLVRQTARLPNVAYIRATNERGDIIYGKDILIPYVNSSDREHFLHLKNNPDTGLFISKPLLIRTDKKWAWLFARRISRTNGDFAGVVTAIIFVDELDKLLAKITLHTGDVATLRDGDIGVIARHVFNGHNPAPPGDTKIAQPFASALQANPNLGTYISGGTSIDSISRTQSYRRSEKYGYYVNVGISRDAALEVWRQQAWILAGLVTTFIFATLSFALFINRAWRKQENTQQSLAREKVLFEAIFRGIQDGIVYANIKREVIAINPAFTTIFGFTIEDIAGKPTSCFYESIEEYERQGKVRFNLSAIELTQPYVVNYRKKNGDIFPGETLGTVIKNSKGEIIGYIGVVRDISELKRAEKEAENMREQLAQASKMESIGHLTAGIAHDFNNMLGAIMGYAELSQLMLAAGKADAISNYHDEILKAVNRAKELISQMLTFSRLSPEIKNSVAPVTLLTPVVKEVVALLRSSIPSTIGLNFRIEDDNIRARIQPVHLHQIILNLGVNARDAMGEYGQIDISVSRNIAEHLHCSACKKAFSGEYAQITVKDSGSGIAAPILKNIFEPFFTTKGVGKGTGMGLSVVHGLVHALGGHIMVKSDVRNGTSFDILLPLELTPPDIAGPAEITGVANIDGARIMVVDDELALANLLHDYLSVHGAHVVSFTNPIKALEYFIQQLDNIDLLITDEAMPGISGMLLAKKMLTIKPSLPIILCTGYSEHATLESIEKSGIQGFFHKPLNMNELAQKIQSLLHKSQT